MNIAKKHFTSILLFAIVLFLFAPKQVQATVEIWTSYSEKNGNVVINSNSNHGYFSSKQNYLYKNEIPILDSIINTLWEEKKLSQKTFIFNIREPFLSSSNNNYLTISNKCQILEGENDIKNLPDSNCYVANITNTDITHDKLLTIILSAQKIHGKVDGVYLYYLNSLKKEFQNDIDRFSGRFSVLDPKWSSNGEYLLQTIWKNGTSHYEIINTNTNQITSLPNLESLPMVDPIWSPNSQYVAYGSDEKILIYDVKNNTTGTILFSKYLEKDAKINKLQLAYDSKENNLIFTFDTNYFDKYKSYLWETKNKTVTFYKDVENIPWTNPYKPEEPHIIPNPRTSKIAIITKTSDGLPTVEIVDKKPDNTLNPGKNIAIVICLSVLAVALLVKLVSTP